MHSRCTRCATSSTTVGADYRLLPPNGGVDDLIALWKVTAKQREPAAVARQRPGSAQLKQRPGRGDLGWSGGKAGS